MHKVVRGDAETGTGTSKAEELHKHADWLKIK
jgi:hypothetical protein